jgi:low affinity Fe/Cu permease
MNKFFMKLANGASEFIGAPAAFVGSVVLLIVWALAGPVFNYSDTWQLVINTATTVITFLVVFLIQNTQNRDYKALQLKIDVIILALSRVDNRFIDLEDLNTDQLQNLKKKILTEGKKGRKKQKDKKEVIKKEVVIAQ